TFTVTATDQAGGTATTNYSITVNPAVTLSPATLPADTINAPYNQTITASNGTGNKSLVVSNVQHPIAGLSVPSSGSNTLTFTGKPTDSLGVQGTPVAYSLTINAPISVAPSTLPSAVVGSLYNQTLTATSGTGNKNLVVSNVVGSIPGLTIPSSGTNAITIQG